MRSFIVCGPESSGNRLVAAILVRAGVSGEGSTNQPVNFDIDYSKEWVVINHFQRVREWIAMFVTHGHKVTVLIPVREVHANATSMLKRGHIQTYDQAAGHINRVIAANLNLAMVLGLRVELIPYSSLENKGMVMHFLERHGLDPATVELPLDMVGQDAPSQPVNMDEGHYEVHTSGM